MSNLIDFVGRLLISALFLMSAYNKIFSIDGTMSWMEGYGIPGLLLYPNMDLEIILSARKVCPLKTRRRCPHPYQCALQV